MISDDAARERIFAIIQAFLCGTDISENESIDGTIAAYSYDADESNQGHREVMFRILGLKYHNAAPNIRSGRLTKKDMSHIESILDSNMERAMKKWKKGHEDDFFDRFSAKVDQALGACEVWEYTGSKKVIKNITPYGAVWSAFFVLINTEKRRVIVADFSVIKGRPGRGDEKGSEEDSRGSSSSSSSDEGDYDHREDKSDEEDAEGQNYDDEYEYCDGRYGW